MQFACELSHFTAMIIQESIFQQRGKVYCDEQKYGTKGGCKEVWPECMVWCGYHSMSLSLMSLPMTPHEALVFLQEYLSHQLHQNWTSPREAISDTFYLSWVLWVEFKNKF